MALGKPITSGRGFNHVYFWQCGVVPEGATPIKKELVEYIIDNADEFNKHKISFLFSNAMEGLQGVNIDGKYTVYFKLTDPKGIEKFFTAPELQELSFFTKHRILCGFFSYIMNMEKYTQEPISVAARERFAEEIGKPQIPREIPRLQDFKVHTDPQVFHQFVVDFNAAQHQQRQQEENNN